MLCESYETASEIYNSLFDCLVEIYVRYNCRFYYKGLSCLSPLWKDAVAYLLVERPFNSNVKSNHREDKKNAVVPITAKFFRECV